GLLEQHRLDVVERNLGRVIALPEQQAAHALGYAIDITVGQRANKLLRVESNELTLAVELKLLVAEFFAACEQVCGVYCAALRSENDAAFYDVFQLANVSRPVVGEHRVNRALRESAQPTPVHAIEFREEVRHQQRDVLASFAY